MQQCGTYRNQVGDEVRLSAAVLSTNNIIANCDPGKFAAEMAEIAVLSQLAPQIYRGFHYFTTELSRNNLFFLAAYFSAEFFFSFRRFLEGQCNDYKQKQIDVSPMMNSTTVHVGPKVRAASAGSSLVHKPDEV